MYRDYNSGTQDGTINQKTLFLNGLMAKYILILQNIAKKAFYFTKYFIWWVRKGF